ncbi:hypothetical protein D3C81_1593460 [compost metagenome]
MRLLAKWHRRADINPLLLDNLQWRAEMTPLLLGQMPGVLVFNQPPSVIMHLLQENPQLRSDIARMQLVGVPPPLASMLRRAEMTPLLLDHMHRHSGIILLLSGRAQLQANRMSFLLVALDTNEKSSMSPPPP